MNLKQKALIDAYLAGMRHGETDGRLSECPFKKGKKANQWKGGFLHAISVLVSSARKEKEK